jgi:cell division protein FtsI (penicillin-binding protein 3)
MSERRKYGRILFSCSVIMAALAGLGFRMTLLHMASDEDAIARIDRARHYEKTLLAGRGNILDRNGSPNVLALNLAVKDVCVDPFEVVNLQKTREVARGLAATLGRPSNEIELLIDKRPDKRFACVQRSVMQEKADRIAQLSLRGVFFQDAVIRYYPHRDFMCHVLGFVNYEGAGSAGVELVLDSSLKGSPGRVSAPVDAGRRELRSRRGDYTPAREGSDVQLTIDQNIQYIVEKALADIVKDCRPVGTWAIVQRVRTGEILAMASRPSFDLNNFKTAAQDSMMNRAIGFVYEPGSTFKAATVASALEAGTVTPKTVFDCENGSWTHMGRPLRDHGSYGVLTVADGLKKSSNILAAKVALTLDRARFDESLRSFGIGRVLGVGLPGEEAGILHPAAKWSGISQSRIAIGQGVSVTALQMLGVFGAIANDGFLMRPYVVSRVVAQDGTVLRRNQPEVLSRPISAKTAATMRTLLTRVTEDGGTGTKARVDGYSAAGKTGTAQKPENGGYSASRYIASFVGFVPADRPELGIIVVVDEPGGGQYYGGQVAAPAFARVAEETLRYMDIEPAGGPPDGQNVAWR